MKVKLEPYSNFTLVRFTRNLSYIASLVVLRTQSQLRNFVSMHVQRIDSGNPCLKTPGYC